MDDYADAYDKADEVEADADDEAFLKVEERGRCRSKILSEQAMAATASS